MRLFVGALFAAILVAGSARAEDRGVQRSAAAEPSRPLELALGGDVLVATRPVCRRDLDLVGCTNPMFRGGQASVQWYVLQPWSVGAIAGLESSGENDGASHSLWYALAESRVHPLGPASVDPWAGVVLGLTAATDTLNGAGDRSVTAYAPSGGVRLGVDFRLAGSFALQVSGAALVSAFPDAKPLGSGQSRDYGTVPWVGASLALVFRPPFSADPTASQLALRSTPHDL